LGKRREKQPSLVELAMQLAVGCAFVFAFNLTFSKYGTSIGGAWLNPLLIIIIITLVISITLRIAYVQEKLKKATINEINKMSGTMFERYWSSFSNDKDGKLSVLVGKVVMVLT